MTDKKANELRLLLWTVAEHGKEANSTGLSTRLMSQRGLASACADILDLLDGEPGATCHIR